VRVLTVRVVPRPGAVLRALLATAEIVLGTVAAHTWAGGTLPSAPWLVAVTALVLVASLVVLHGKVRAAVAVPALAGAQVLLHCWLVALAPGHSMPGHQMSGQAASGPHLELTTPMLAAHLAAALLTALVWGLRRRAVDVVLAWGAVAGVVISSVRRVAAGAAPTVVRHQRVLAVAPRRGPPGRLAPA
jgi:hypothetical protein